MANRLRICMRICIVGGRAFGKTALVKAVAQIPCFIAKNYRNQKNRDSGMSFDDLAQTRWDDVKDWRFNFTVEEGEKKTDKILSFADYAGEYFEEAYEEPSTGSDADGGNKILRKLGSLIRRIWPWGGHKSDRRRINKFFYHPDGVIIMLPRDFSRKDEKGRDVYKRSIYEDRVLDYLAKLQPGTPVQIVISKWDLNKEIEPKGANEDEVVLSSAFKNCYVRILNCYRNRNGKDYDAGVMAISTKEFLDGEWVCFGDTRYNEAYNVRELFKKLSDAADVARTERLKTDWAQAKWWKRMFVMPWESLSVRRKNSTDGEIRSIFRQSWLRFGGFLVASAIVAFATIVSVAGLTEKFRLDGIDSEIAAATNALPKVTKEKLADRDAQLATNKWTHPMFFIPRLAELKRKQGVLKDAFVKYLEDDLVTQLKNPRVINMSPWDVHPDELDVRASNRLAIVENQIARIPEERSSDKIQSRKIEELSIIANLKADRPLNQALYDIGRTNENAKLRAMDAVYKNSPDKKDVRKEDFVRLKLEIGRLEERVSTTLSNTLNKIDNDNKARDWSANVKRAELKINEISNYLGQVFIPESGMYKKWELRLAELKSRKADDSHYGPFDQAYQALKRDDLNAIASFKKDYPSEKYPNRKEIYGSLAKQERDLLRKIMEDIGQQELAYEDDKSKSMKWRIGQAARRTNEYVVALGKLRKSDGEYDVMDKKRQSTEVWINDHKKYMDYETDWDCVVAKPEAEQVRAIVEFLRSHKKEMYPEYAGRLGEAGEIAKKLSAQFVQDCTNEILGIRGKQSGSWQVHVRDASNRIEKIEAILPSVLDSDKPKLVNLINREKNDIVKWTKNGCFGDRLVRVRQMPKDKVLKGIMEFRKEFNEADFPGHSEDYVALSNKEIKVLGDINTTFTNTLAKIPEEAVTNFQGRLKRSVKIHQAYERALEFIPDDHPASVTYKQGSKNAAEDMERYEKWINLRDEACRLVEFAEDVERKTDDEERQCGQEQIISKVGGFYHRFPKRNFHDDELQEFYGNVKNVLDNAEKAVYSRYQGEDGACIVSSGMSDEERIKITENRRDLCKKYMDLLLPDHSDFWSILSRRKDELSHRLGDASFEKEFKESYAKLKGIIGNDKLSAEERIARINSFLAEYDKPDYTKKAFVKTAIEDLRYLKGNLDILQKFNGLQEELDNLKRPIADNSDDADNLGVYRRRCGDLDVKFQAYERYAVTANMAKKARKQLAGEIKWVRGQLGETSWVGIKKKETAYKENPTKENYDALLRVIKAFDDKKDDNPEHAKGVKDIKEKVEKDWRLAQDVNRKRQEFIDNPNRQTFMYFISRVGNFVDNGYREKNNMSNAYEAFYKQVFNSVHQQANGLAFRWKWLGYNFKDTNLEHWTDYWLELWFDDTRVCEVSDISHDNWNPEIRDYKIHKGNIMGDSYIAPHAALKIKLVHSQSPQKDNEMSVNWYEMLAMGIKFSGEFTYTFYISGNGNKTKRGELLIKFSDLPYLPNGDL